MTVKVLLDENLDHALRNTFGHHEVVPDGPASRMASCYERQRKTGLMFCRPATERLATSRTFSGRRLAIVALSAIQLPIIKKHLMKIVAAIDDAH